MNEKMKKLDQKSRKMLEKLVNTNQIVRKMDENHRKLGKNLTKMRKKCKKLAKNSPKLWRILYNSIKMGTKGKTLVKNF